LWGQALIALRIFQTLSQIQELFTDLFELGFGFFDIEVGILHSVLSSSAALILEVAGRLRCCFWFFRVASSVFKEPPGKCSPNPKSREGSTRAGLVQGQAVTRGLTVVTNQQKIMEEQRVIPRFTLESMKPGSFPGSFGANFY
jgi:hypothetical protein